VNNKCDEGKSGSCLADGIIEAFSPRAEENFVKLYLKYPTISPKFQQAVS
jgi:hypothetical protein